MNAASRLVRTRAPARVEIETIEIVRDAQVAVTLCSVANDLEVAADLASCLTGGSRLEELLVRQAKVIRELLGKDQAI